MKKSKILLIYPPQTLNVPPVTYNTPVGLLYIGSYLKERGYEIKLLDCLVEEDYEKKIFDEVNDAICVGVYLMSCHIRNMAPILDRIKQEYPSVKIVVGGPHATLFPQQTAADQSIDFVCKDEGEETMLELVQAFESNKTDYSTIKGITYKANGVVCDNPARPPLDMDTLPYIDWDLCNPKVIQDIRNGKIIRVSTNRGCPYSCTFCIHVNTMNRRMRFRSPEKVLGEIQRNIEKYNARRVGIRDDMHFVNMKQTREIVNGLIDRKIKITWLAQVRADYFKSGFLDDEFLALLVKSGLNKLSVGCESGSQRILDKLEKGITVEQIISAAQKMKKFNIVPVCAFLFCIPGETHKDFIATMKLIKTLHSINPETWINGPAMLRPYPGGKLYEECVHSYGYQKPESFRDWTKHDYASQERLPWVTNIDFRRYLWISLLYGRNKITYASIAKEEKGNILRMIPRFIIKWLWTMRFKYLNYSFTIDYKLYAWYFRMAHGTNPDIS